jgi:RNA polymerase sigma-70 factor, ECF subfamily
LDRIKESLVARLRAGDQKAAGELVDIFYEQVFLFMVRLGYNIHISEDLTQEVFLQAWQHIDQLQNEAALNCWFYRIAGNVAKMHLREQKIRAMDRIEGIEPALYINANMDKAVHHEQLETLRKAVGVLPIKLRQAVVLHYMQHLSLIETAQVAGVRQGTIKSRLSRGLKILRKQVSTESGETL